VCRAPLARAPRKRSRIEAALDDEEAALELRLSMSTEQIEHWETHLQQLIDAQEQARSARERLIERLLDRIEHQEAERIDLRAQQQTLRQQRLQQQ
jgi:DNA polymerase IIIc chi subunit